MINKKIVITGGNSRFGKELSQSFFGKNIIYTSDNLGYLYALNYETNKIEWAKNYKTPFRSNLKIIENKLVTSTENNNLYFFDKMNGNIFKLIQ